MLCHRSCPPFALRASTRCFNAFEADGQALTENAKTKGQNAAFSTSTNLCFNGLFNRCLILVGFATASRETFRKRVEKLGFSHYSPHYGIIT